MCQITCSEWSYPEEPIYHKLTVANVKRFSIELYVSIKQKAAFSKHESQAKKLAVCDRETLMNGFSSNWYLVQNNGKDSSFASTSANACKRRYSGNQSKKRKEKNLEGKVLERYAFLWTLLATNNWYNYCTNHISRFISSDLQLKKFMEVSYTGK